MELIFQVKNQRLYLTTVNKVVAGSKNYLTASFSFTDDWDGAVKVAQFTRGTSTTNVTINSATGKCTVPQSVLSDEGEFYVSVYGTINNQEIIITANAIKIVVLPSGFVANPGTISADDAAAIQAHADAVTAITNNSTTSAGGYVHHILFTVKNQSMYLTTRGKVVADSQGYLGAKFIFTDDWAGTIKIAQFKRNGLFYNIKLNANDECTVPWEVLVDEGTFIANVFGNNPQNEANRIITVNPVEVHVEKSGLTEGELPSNPTLGLDGQVLYEIYQYAEAASASASSASTSAASSQRYATEAGGYASDANTAAGLAGDSALAAATSASNAARDAAAAANMITEVSNLKTEITALSVTVNEAVDNMDTYQQAAADNAALAEKWATYTGGTVDGLEYSAKHYAETASAQATAASTSATAAATSASAAASSASDAADSAEDAATSETNSANSETNASNSASAAAASATQAAQAATAASSSAGSAAASASNASSSATSASNSATAAATSETNARNSATSAAGSASDASDSADAAASSESNASTYAGNAQTSATNASNSASAAAASATQAAQAQNATEQIARTISDDNIVLRLISLENLPHYEFDNTTGYLYVVY